VLILRYSVKRHRSARERRTERFAGSGGKIPAQEEMAQIKAELATAREREKEFRKEQLLLLQQMQEIRTALAAN
jgi:hypothetical protein